MNATNEGEREARRLAENASEEARKLGDTARDEAAKLAETAKEVGRGQAEKQFDRTKHVVEDQIGTVEAALDGAAERLERENSPLAGYASDLSSKLSGLSARIESASVDDLARDGRRLARENPALFMLGAVAVGFVASRFLKASESADHDYPFDDRPDDDYARGAYARGEGGYRQSPYGGRDGSYSHRGYRSDESGGRDGAYARTSTDAYRSPVASPAGPRDPVDPMPRAPMDSTAVGSGSTAGTVPGITATAEATSPRVNRPVNDLGADAPDHANAGAAPRNSNKGEK